ncbi:MAG: efflux RND transporter periplasmic adaptor subunit [Bacteroidales bacterium]|nr:efflux RND transporter periplasmic adaptor subunit [Bacteroidales bacterium]
MNTLKYLIFLFFPLLCSCNKNNSTADAFGNFQADEIIVSAEVSGPIVVDSIEEGMIIKKGQLALQIDTVQLALKVKELNSKIRATKARRTNIDAQSAIFEQQKKMALVDFNRIKNMLADSAATQKQLDDIAGEIEVLNRQISSVKSNLESINAEAAALEAGVLQIHDMLSRTKVVAPISGTIIEQYAETGEMAIPGKALFKVANLETMVLKAYVSARQLPEIETGQKVKVCIDGADGQLICFEGSISWISAEAEFTPKNIQTREERVNQVYAIKIRVKNNGPIKINMPGEVWFKV